MVRVQLEMCVGMESTQIEMLVPYYSDAVKTAGISEEEFYGSRFKCLWLLHGLGGTCRDWINYTQVETFAEEKNCFVICLSGGDGFYVDGPKGCGRNWETLLMKTVWDYLHRLYPMMSEDREDNTVAGLSMGGYGAMRYVLKYPDRFGYAGVLSAGVNMPQRYAEGENFNNRLQLVFGEPETVKGGSYDLFRAAKDLKESGQQLPRIYMACGTKDWEYEPNSMFRDYLRSLGYDVYWDEAGYTHEWRFWNLEIKKVLDFAIPEDVTSAVFSRGHLDAE